MELLKIKAIEAEDSYLLVYHFGMEDERQLLMPKSQVSRGDPTRESIDYMLNYTIYYKDVLSWGVHYREHVQLYVSAQIEY